MFVFVITCIVSFKLVFMEITHLTYRKFRRISPLPNFEWEIADIRYVRHTSPPYIMKSKRKNFKEEWGFISRNTQYRGSDPIRPI